MPYTPSSNTQLGSCHPAPGGPSIGSPFTLPDTAHIVRAAVVDDGFGSTSRTPVEIGEFACRLVRTAGMYEQSQGSEDQAIANWVCYMDVLTDIRPQDQVTVNGQIFEVTGSDKGTTDATYISVELMLLNRK